MTTRLTRVPAAGAALLRALRGLVQQERDRDRLRALYPGVHFEWPIHFRVDDYAAMTIAAGAYIGPYSEIVVLKTAPQSPVPGSLDIAHGVRIGMGANLRAAGGSIRIGADTQIGQHVGLIASNHLFDRESQHVHANRWDAQRTGVVIGAGCWLGAGVTVLPGVTIGDGAVIGAGAVVTRPVGEREIWHGEPARPSQSP